MSTSGNYQNFELILNLAFGGAKSEEVLPDSVAYVFDVNGGFIASEAIDGRRAGLALPARIAHQTARIFIGPPVRAAGKPTIASLTRLGAHEVRQRIGPDLGPIHFPIPEPIWRCWFFCECQVSGKLVTTVTRPDGSSVQLPVCNSQVTICEVWPWERVIPLLPEPILARLRDEVVAVVLNPLPSPGPVETGVAQVSALALQRQPASAAAIPRLRPPASSLAARSRTMATRSLELANPVAPTLDAMTFGHVSALARSASTAEIASRLIDLYPIYIDWLCLWDWLEPWLYVDCLETVPTDDNGNFYATVWYPCCGPTPNLYFSAQQLQGSNWVTIYEPWLRCGAYWNYACGTTVTLNVTDPAAIPCNSPTTVNPPPGADNWVLVTAVGGTWVWGSPSGPPSMGCLSSPPVGWLQPDGLTDYGSVVGAPFGGYLGFRSGVSISIPNPGMTYYRWSYRKLGTSSWFYMSDTVVRHYVKETPPALPTFPVDVMGPLTVSGVPYLYRFKPLIAPAPLATDPAGTITYWPTDDLFGDIYSGYLDTTSLPGGVAAAAGVYQIKLEVFDANANPVMPGASTFSFILPCNIDGSGDITARAAEPGELDVDGGFIFNLHIDNNRCGASIDAPAISGGGVVDSCGFLNYSSTANPISIDFEATHLNGFATFDFSLIRGITDVGYDASGYVWNTSAGVYTAPADTGDFTSNGLTVGDLLGTCVNGAFAEVLNVYATATTGWGDSITAYDASFVRAFALAAAS